MLRLPVVKKPSFSGHESFPLRYAWLKKGYDALKRDAAVFSQEGAMTDLGVGKNMVRSIRHWGVVCGLWDARPETRGRDLAPTALGDALLGPDGWDPFMDEVGTIWLLHWLLTRDPESATSFWWLFSRQKPGSFTKEELEGELREIAHAADGGRAVPESTIKRDVDVLIRCYTRARGERGEDAEDTINSPLMALGLVRPVEGQRSTFVAPLASHPTLPNGIFRGALLDWCARKADGKDRAISFDELLYGMGSPGRVFRLTEAALMDRLHLAVQQGQAYLRFDETAGLRQVLVTSELPNWTTALDDHYQRTPDTEAA